MGGASCGELGVKGMSVACIYWYIVNTEGMCVHLLVPVFYYFCNQLKKRQHEVYAPVRRYVEQGTGGGAGDGTWYDTNANFYARRHGWHR